MRLGSWHSLTRMEERHARTSHDLCENWRGGCASGQEPWEEQRWDLKGHHGKAGACRAQEMVRGGDGYGRDKESVALHSARTQRPRGLWAGSGCVATQWRVPRWLHPPPPPPAARPSPRPALSPLPPSRLLPGHLPQLLPRGVAGALAARRALGGGGGTVRGPRTQDSGPGAKVCQQPRQAKQLPGAACCPLSHSHPGIAAPGDRAAARLAPRRGRRDGNLRWELRRLQPGGTLLLQAALRDLHVAAAPVPPADT